MAAQELCTEEEIHDLVHGFYAKVRQDAMLGPVFDAHIDDWDVHLAKMCQFWSSLLRGTATYSGTPMPKHVALPSLNAQMFTQWLALFEDTLRNVPNRPFAEKAIDFANRIARSLWFGYQINNNPDRMPSDIATA